MTSREFFVKIVTPTLMPMIPVKSFVDVFMNVFVEMDAFTVHPIHAVDNVLIPGFLFVPTCTSLVGMDMPCYGRGNFVAFFGTFFSFRTFFLLVSLICGSGFDLWPWVFFDTEWSKGRDVYVSRGIVFGRKFGKARVEIEVFIGWR